MREMRVEWFTPYEHVLDASRGPEWTQWFTGGRLNIAHNCLDRWAESDRVACIWEGESGATRTVTFRELRADANRVANGLRALGLGSRRPRGALPADGAGDPADSVRLLQSGADGGADLRRLRRGRDRHAAGRIRARACCSRRSIWSGAASGFRWRRRCRSSPARRSCCRTGGRNFSRGSPHGVRHGVARFGGARLHPLYFGNHRQAEGHGAHACRMPGADGEGDLAGLRPSGRRSLLLALRYRLDDGAVDDSRQPPVRRDDLPVRWRARFSGADAAVGDDRPARHHDVRRLSDRDSRPRQIGGELPAMASLRLLGSTGEPWDEASWLWYFEHVGRRRCPIINISGGTEIVGSFLFPLPIQPLKPCSLGGPAPGMATEVVDEHGRPVRGRRATWSARSRRLR